MGLLDASCCDSACEACRPAFDKLLLAEVRSVCADNTKRWIGSALITFNVLKFWSAAGADKTLMDRVRCETPEALGRLVENKLIVCGPHDGSRFDGSAYRPLNLLEELAKVSR